MLTRILIAAMLVAAVPAGAAPASAAASTATANRGLADVRMAHGGVPCFTIAEGEERRGGAPRFASISVGELARLPDDPAWRMAMPAGRTFPLLFSMCVPYGGRVPSLPQTPAEPLLPGRLYEVRIAVQAQAAPLPAIYSARFCLMRQADGNAALLLVDARAPARCGAADGDGARKRKRGG